ncbi:hypothetical protein [Agrobacterium tumefaciens]|jgi:hypothetical protein|uniref:hypothetical protein n=1 Tax=Agrobacterium tumefaciens TaxID=358 RepID=UPI000A72F03E|nr:hypothetical protein [Agrobacterium tumefaciens]
MTAMTSVADVLHDSGDRLQIASSIGINLSRSMRVIQALHWFRDERANLEAVVDGIVRYLARSPHRQPVVKDLRENIHGIPAWMYQAVETITGDPQPQKDGSTLPGREGMDEHAPEFR